MKAPTLASVILSAAVVQCGFLDSIEEAILDFTSPSPADLHLDDINKISDDLLASVSAKANGILGDIPHQARSAWRTVIDEIPNGAGLLADQMSQYIYSKTALPVKGKLPSAEGFNYLVTDAKFPGTQLRVKNTKDLGIDDVKQLSGYIDFDEEDKHFFFWFFEARNNPKDAPTILWLNGGPGCSSMTGLFFELGPSSIDENAQPIRRPESWNTNANVIFLDQPVNTGFSYSSSQNVKDTVTAGEDVYAFLELFFTKFPQYAENGFHIAGESYAGHYIPVFAGEIVKHEDRSFPLDSVLIGNGLIDPLRQYDFYEPQACGGGEYPAVISEEECQDMIDSQPRCNSLISSCYESQSAWICVPASIYCNNAMMGPYQKSGRNVYDIREDCSDSSDGLCYPQMDWIAEYLNTEEVREALGITDVEKFESCNFDVNSGFLFNGDWMLPYYTNVIDLLELGIPVLDYAGLADFICNALGTDNFASQVEWSGHEEFASSPVKPWLLKDGSKAGRFRNYKHFTSLQIYEAGHMAPYNQPQALFEMVDEWVNKKNYGFE
ncbi:carboxypeptidase C [Starmerella bacillaris]|uniref:Carboxypeptidase n=1 Tax=Starmerella bacillaris TaxID=1247836 RepID=A0AAV5RQ71_STABA|nr:carboxypeptidase C [Starmerella bacillaris]